LTTQTQANQLNNALSRKTKEDRAKDVVENFYDHWKEETEDLREKWEGIYLIAWVFKALNKLEPENKTLINKCYEHIQLTLPRLYGQRPKYQLFARGNKSDVDVMATKALLDYQWDDYDLDDMFYDCGTWFLTYGTHVILVGTDLAVKNKATGKLGPTGEKEMQKYVARDTQGIKHIPIWDFLIDPKEKDLQKAPGVGYREKNVLLSDLKASGLYSNLDKLSVTRDGGDENDEHRELSGQMENKSGVDASRMTTLPVVEEVVHYYGLFEEKPGDDPVEYIITIAGSSGKWQVIRMEENFFKDENDNPYRPFVDFHDEKDPHFFYSIGEVEKIMGLQAAYNTLLRQRIDAVRKQLRPKWAVQEDSIINESSLKTEESNAIVRYKQGYQPPMSIIPPDVTANLYRDIGQLGNEINSVSGMTDFTKGEGGASSTATVAALNAEVGNHRFAMKQRNLNKSIKKYMRIRLHMNRQFFNEGQLLRLIKDGKSEVIDVPPFPEADVDIIIEAGSTMLPNSMAEQQKAQLLSQIAAQYGQVPFNQLPPLIQFSVKESFKSLGYDEGAIEKALGIVEEDPADVEEQVEMQRLQAVADKVDSENKEMAAGADVPVEPTDDHEFEVKAHADFLVSPEGEKLPPEIKQIFFEHMFNHKQHEEQQPKRGGKSINALVRRPEGNATPPPEQGLPAIEGESNEEVPAGSEQAAVLAGI